jgi:uncharacterized delta-60 repeat protein
VKYYCVSRFVTSSFSLFSFVVKTAVFGCLISVFLLCGGVNVSFAAPGDLDPSFGSGGKVTTPVGTGRDLAQAVALQPDGKMVVAGYAQNDFAVVRYNPNGSLDTGFGTSGTGKVLTPIGSGTQDEAYAVAVQADGKIVVAGFTVSGGTDDFAVVRYQLNGTLDTSFGTGGKVITPVGSGDDLASAVIIQPDGKIIVAGSSGNTDFALVRYNADGSLDTAFGTGGKTIFTVSSVSGQARAAALQTDGKILVGGLSGVDVGQSTLSKFTLVRFNTNGSVDTAFGTSGKVVTSISQNRFGSIFGLAIQPDGKVLVSGSDNGNSDGNTAVVRYLSNGSLDTGFGTGGIVTTRVGTVSSLGETVLLQSNGKIVVVGDSYSGSNIDFGVVRLNADGSIDNSFGTSGKVITAIGSRDDSVRDAVIQADGKIVVIGHSENASAGFLEDFALVRYLGDAVTVRPSPFDFDGDGKDISIFRPSVGEWWINRSASGQTSAAQFGVSSDKPVPADFTGDGKADIAFWRPVSGEWFILRSEDASYLSFPFGTSGDIPVVGDFDADGKADPGIFRPSNSTWFILKSSGGTIITTFGQAGDVPVAADYDGDGKADIAIYRPSVGQWWIQRSSNNTVYAFQFGNSSDKPVQGDYTGDGKADAAFFRPSTGEWFILRSEDSSFYSVPFGTSGDLPSPGDYDGDGKFDMAVFRPTSSTWFVNRTTAGILITGFGTTGDKPLPNVFVP